MAPSRLAAPRLASLSPRAMAACASALQGDVEFALQQSLAALLAPGGHVNAADDQ